MTITPKIHVLLASAVFGIFLVPVPAFAQSAPAPTLIQQLMSYLAYEQEELDEYGAPPACGSNCYHYYRVNRLNQQLTAAQAAAAAGQPLPPVLTESGQVAPLF